MHGPGVLDGDVSKRMRNGQDEGVRVDTEDNALRGNGVHQRPEDVEYSAQQEVMPRCGDVFERGVVVAGQRKEMPAASTQRASSALSPSPSCHAEAFKYIGGARLTRLAAVARLGDATARGGGHMAAAVDMLTVWSPSPPVPTMSRSGQLRAALRMRPRSMAAMELSLAV